MAHSHRHISILLHDLVLIKMSCVSLSALLSLYFAAAVRGSNNILKHLKNPGPTGNDASIAVNVFHLNITKLGFYILFNSQGHIGTGSQHFQFWCPNRRSYLCTLMKPIGYL